MGNEAVFRGKDLEIRLFQSEPGHYVIVPLGMDGFTQVAAIVPCRMEAAPRAFTVHIRIRPDIIVRFPQIHCHTCLFKKKPYKGHIQVEQGFRTGLQYGKKLVLIIFKIGGSPVGRYNGSPVLSYPGH